MHTIENNRQTIYSRKAFLFRYHSSTSFAVRILSFLQTIWAYLVENIFRNLNIDAGKALSTTVFKDCSLNQWKSVMLLKLAHDMWNMDMLCKCNGLVHLLSEYSDCLQNMILIKIYSWMKNTPDYFTQL